MASLFNETDVQTLFARINSLNQNSAPIWGKMNVGQMLTHCQRTFEVALSELKLKRGLIGFLFGGIAKKNMAGDKPFKRNLPTAPQFVVKDNRDIEKEKQNLISKIEKFRRLNQKELEATAHPFFGKMTIKEWDTLSWKHLDHHLQQFGV